VRTAIDNYQVDGVALFDGAGADGTRTNIFGGGGADLDAAGNTGGTGGNAILDSLVMELSGQDGSQVFSFDSGTTLDQMVSAINAQSDATGVGATMTVNGTSGVASMSMLSSAYGTDAFVGVDVISEGNNGTFNTLISATRDIGTDIIASINGVAASGKGNTVSINTATLGMSATVDAGSSTDFSFNITGGGAVFQLGPDVVTNQQARLGISSMNTAKLGGTNGRLYELGSGGDAELKSDPNKAAKIVDEVLGKVSLLRGRLGAFQKTMVDTNINTLTDTLTNLTAANSSIRDADFAAESANLTRGQVLVQAGTSVLSIANQSPQSVLSLLR
jgi:flagellin